MKTFGKYYYLSAALFVITLLFFNSCSANDKDSIVDEANLVLSTTDESALLFMLEEEKLARDTYAYLDDLWSINQFANIKKSEQSHMNAVENLLISSNISYSILPVGEFNNSDLQSLYNQFVEQGSVSLINALKIGATIEDLDIVDLQRTIDATSNSLVISVFEKLKCGSGNHLRSFVFAIESEGESYTPQFLTQDEYDTIINGTQERCGSK